MGRPPLFSGWFDGIGLEATARAPGRLEILGSRSFSRVAKQPFAGALDRVVPDVHKEELDIVGVIVAFP